ncbi:MAG: DNA-processing protein DprA [Protaetiibacter sp.]
MDAREREAAALFALLKAKPRDLTWGEIASEVAYEGSAVRALRSILDDGALIRSFDEDELIVEAAAMIALWGDQGHRFVTVLDEAYPARLLDIRETPPFLFYEGVLSNDDRGMSVVGSRDATPQGIAQAGAVAEYLVEQGLTVIAGLAAGIDTAAHKAALGAGGRTVAFIGTGIAEHYPSGNASLQQQIAKRGLVLSQFYPDQPPTQQTFPIRNAAMSGYGLATIIVEAGEKSGTRIQARLAVGHGRPLILSSKVATGTKWGADLIGMPNVYIASTLAELKDCVQEVLAAPDRLSSALAALASA